jgi:gluconolactonase
MAQSEKATFTAFDATRLIAPGAALTCVSDQFDFTEGPAVNAEGVVFFTDQPNNKIWRYGTDGSLSVFMEQAGRSNGMYFDPDGNLVTCADEKNEIWSISPQGDVTVLMTDHEGSRLNGPNDLWVDAQGNIYFTDPFYERKYWWHGGPEVFGEYLYFLPKGAAQPEVVDKDYEKPNGIIGTPDGKQLYVADIDADKTYRYDINPDASLSNRQLFVEQGSDGMILDERGNLYLTGGDGVTVYSPTGEKVAQIPVDEEWTGNICFAGVDLRTLFITASKSVYTLEMQVAGAARP